MICQMHLPREMSKLKKYTALKKNDKWPHIWQQSMIAKQENCYLDTRMKGKRLVN